MMMLEEKKQAKKKEHHNADLGRKTAKPLLNTAYVSSTRRIS